MEVRCTYHVKADLQEQPKSGPFLAVRVRQALLPRHRRNSLENRSVSLPVFLADGRAAKESQPQPEGEGAALLHQVKVPGAGPFLGVLLGRFFKKFDLSLAVIETFL
jgi:hypothetical protein